MSITEIIELITLIVTTIGMISSIVVSIVKGQLKEFILQTMEEAEELYKNDPNKATKKLEYVMTAVKEKYKIVSIVLNVKEFIEKVIKVTKKINVKG